MKKLLRVIAVALSVAVFVPVLGACHKKDEIAYTIGGHKFTSAMYSCVLTLAASGARSDIDTFVKSQNSDSSSSSSSSSKETDYTKYKFDAEGKVSSEGTVSYNDYVKQQAKALGCYEVTLNVWAGNTSAEHFYEKMGMKTKERQMEYIL